MFYRKKGNLYYADPRTIIIYTDWPDLRCYKINKITGEFRSILPNDRDFNLRRWSKSTRKTNKEHHSQGYSKYIPRMPSHFNDMLLRKEYINNIPSGFRVKIKGIKSNHWKLLTMAAKTPEKHSMFYIKNYPALAIMISDMRRFTGINHPRISYMKKLIDMKPLEILEIAGFPATSSTLKVLGKIQKKYMSVGILLTIKNIYDNNDKYMIKKIQHCDSIFNPVIYTVNSCREAISDKLINELMTLDLANMVRATTILEDTIRIKHRLGEEITAFDSMASLETEHNALGLRFLGYNDNEALLRMEFPEPLFAGNDYITPIKTPEELIKEAEEMENCAVTYAGKICSQRTYIYMIHYKGEKAMISIDYIRGEWEITQIYGLRNQLVSSEIIKTAMEWFREKEENIEPRNYLQRVNNE